MELLERLSESVVRGAQDESPEIVKEAIDQGIEPSEILKDGLIAGMDVVGRKFQDGEFFIPHMLLAARAMKTALEVLRPFLAETGAKPRGRVLLGTVEGDHHDIGKNLVRIMLEGKGFDVVDIGIDSSPAAFAEAAAEGIDIVGISALLSTTAPFIEDTIQALVKAGVRDRVKVVIGGGAVTAGMAEQYGADGYGRDASGGADLCVRLMEASS